MSKKPEPIIKKYIFSADEYEALQKVEVALIAFEQAVMGMQVNKDIILHRAYRRCGIGEREGFTRSISYNLTTNQITVTYTPKDEVTPEAK